MRRPAGSTDTIEVKCYHTANGADVLYDPSELVVDITRSDGAEEAFTYGGTDPGDSNLIRNSVGDYELRYVYPAVRAVKVRVRTIDTVTGDDWPSKSKEVPIDIDADPRTYADFPVPTTL